jgi:broad specificity phosphatase PhoE
VTEFLLVRHGETDWNREQRFQGHADQPLNELGREQARALADELAGEQVDAVYSSDLRRAHETAEIVAERLGVPVVTDPALREIDVGEWQGLTWPEIEARYPEGVRDWHEKGYGWTEGETYEQLGERVVGRLRELAAAHPDQTLVVVAHGGTVRAARAHADGDTVAAHRKRQPAVANCEVFRLQARQLD